MNNKLLIVLIIIILLIMVKKSKSMSEAKKTPGQINFNRLNLLAVHTLRNDAMGKGHYNAPRSHAGNHKGVDLVSAPFENVKLNVPGVVKYIGYAYDNDKRFNSYHITLAHGLVLKLLYVKPLYKVGDTIKAGATIATAQNIAAKHGGGMLNHLHVELLENGKNIDPTKYVL
jgi:murein DD-endopeptidase MepM/ murein hydrolase activator NlpD